MNTADSFERVVIAPNAIFAPKLSDEVTITSPIPGTFTATITDIKPGYNTITYTLERPGELRDTPSPTHHPCDQHRRRA